MSTPMLPGEIAKLMGEEEVDWAEVLMGGIRTGKLPLETICRLMEIGYLEYKPLWDDWRIPRGAEGRLSVHPEFKAYFDELNEECQREYQEESRRRDQELLSEMMARGILSKDNRGVYRLSEKGERSVAKDFRWWVEGGNYRDGGFGCELLEVDGCTDVTFHEKYYNHLRYSRIFWKRLHMYLCLYRLKDSGLNLHRYGKILFVKEPSNLPKWLNRVIDIAVRFKDEDGI